AAQARAREQEYLGYGISYENLQENLSNRGLRSADIQDLRQMGRLPFASKEVEWAAASMNGEPRLNEVASLTNFLRESAGANILHLSMHGLLRPNPMESALVFSGDEAEEYALLEMKDVLGGHYPAELTVLSACHTGGGTLMTSEGMQSIGRAFTAAGSRATITSTWAARDESTYDILGRFFEELSDGVAKDIALQRAVTTYLAEGTAADRNPDHWANLTLTGRVDAIGGSEPVWPYVAGVLVMVGLGATLWRRRRVA
ncbi:MAG: CHAT domain-containing protein, partial [Bacteroidota bacterium]